MFFLLLFLLLFAHGPPADASSPTAYPCINGRIMMAIDISTELSDTNFEKQISFLSHQVFTDEWTNLDRFTLVQYAEFAWERPFGVQEFAVDVREQLQSISQQLPVNLTRAFETIDYWQSEEANDVVHLIVFVSKIDQQIVDASRPFVQRLQQKNYELTFVALGAQLDAALFSELSPNLIQWDVDGQNVPAGWSQQLWAAYGCGDEPSGNTTATPGGFTCPTQTSPLPITYATRPTQTPTPAGSCQKGTFAWIQDAGGISLNATQYQASIAFIDNNLYPRIYGQVKNFWYGFYTSNDSSVWDFTDYTPDDFDIWFLGRHDQDTKNGTLLKALTNPNLHSLIDSTGDPITLVVLVSSINETIVGDCTDAVRTLQSKGVRMVLVALNNFLDVRWMTKLMGSRQLVQYWDPSQQPQPSNMKRWFNYTVGCPVNEEPFVPCGDQTGLQISLLFSLLQQFTSTEQAEAITNFMTNEFFADWTHAERISLYFYNYSESDLHYFPPDSFTNITSLAYQISSEYRNMVNHGDHWVGRKTYKFVTQTNVALGINYYKQSYIVFADHWENDDCPWLQETIPYLHGSLTIVALNNDVKLEATQCGLNVIDWSDPTKSEPDDWKQEFWFAFGCAGNPPSDM